jgi:hypothetical protein
MRTAAITLGSWICLALASAGCGGGTQLVPARSANRAPEQPSAAVADAGGVRLLVEGDAWPGKSAALARGVSAILVIVENRGDHPVVINRDDFVLQGTRGERFTTIAPSRVPAAGPSEPVPVPEAVFSDEPSARGNPVSPPPGPNQVNSLSRVETSFPQSPLDFRTATVTPQSFRHDIESRALAEGTLAPGQKSAGFVYFAGGLGGERQLTFQARVEKKPHGGGHPVDVAMANIPLRVQ